MPERRVGKVEHYYPKVKAAAVGLSAPLKVGDKVHIVGHGDDFEEKVTSLQLDHEPIQEGKPGQSVGLWVKERVHEGDDVYVVEGGGEGRGPPRGGTAATAGKKTSSGGMGGPRNAQAKPKRASRRAPTRRKARAKKPARRAKAAKRSPARRTARKAPKRKKPARKAGKAKGTRRSGTARKAKRSARRGR